MDTNTWALSPSHTTDDDYYFVAGAVAGAGAITLLKTSAGSNGVGYKVTFHSAGDSSARTWTIVGHAMGTPENTATTEVVAAGNNATTTSTNYYDTITSITASGAMTGNQKVGYDATYAAYPALHNMNLLGVHWVATGTAGYVSIRRNSATGTVLLRIDTPADATASGTLECLKIRTMGSSTSDFILLMPSNVTFYTLIFG